MTEQVETSSVCIGTIMRSAAFAAGVEDVRKGRYPRYDEYGDNWSYECGRQWARVAPMKMPIKIGRRLNPAAVKLFEENIT